MNSPILIIQDFKYNFLREIEDYLSFKIKGYKRIYNNVEQTSIYDNTIIYDIITGCLDVAFFEEISNLINENKELLYYSDIVLLITNITNKLKFQYIKTDYTDILDIYTSIIKIENVYIEAIYSKEIPFDKRDYKYINLKIVTDIINKILNKEL